MGQEGVGTSGQDDEVASCRWLKCVPRHHGLCSLFVGHDTSRSKGRIESRQTHVVVRVVSIVHESLPEPVARIHHPNVSLLYPNVSLRSLNITLFDLPPSATFPIPDSLYGAHDRILQPPQE